MKEKIIRNISLLTICLLIGFSVFAQKTHSVIYGDTNYMQKGEIFLELKDSLPDGIWSVYDSEKKVILISGLYENSKRNGVYLKYYFYEGRYYLELKETYINGNLHGEFITWFKNGISERGEYQNKKRSGNWYKFYENGNISEQLFYSNDSLLNWINYFDNGTISGKGFGSWTFRQDSIFEFYRNGSIKYKGFFINGKLMNWEEFYENGLIKAKGLGGNYSTDGASASLNHKKILYNPKNGEWTFYTKDGNIEKKEIWENDVLKNTIKQ